MLVSKLKSILKNINECVVSDKGEKLPGNVFYMNDGNILCCDRITGESRYPYSCDGYTLWAHSTGHIQTKDGILNVFKPVYDSPEPSVEFFVGVEMENGEYFPISILGAAKQLFEIFDVKRYVVYSLSAAYYIAETDFAAFAVRVDMSERREMRFSFVGVNKTNEALKFKFTSFFNPLLRNSEYDNMWEIMSKTFKYEGDGSFILERGTGKDFYALALKRKITGFKLLGEAATNSLTKFNGSERRTVSAAECLKKGAFTNSENGIYGIASEILDIEISDNGRIDYVLPITADKEAADDLLSFEIDISQIDKEIEEKQITDENRFKNFDVNFEGLNSDKITDALFNKFINSVQKQVDSCAMGRYYVNCLLGTRDVFQQLEQAILWDPKQAKEKIIRALGYIDPSGRAPRQFSIPNNEDCLPQMDLREFIDQGNWIISCIYTYITWTNDISILDEICGYYEFASDEKVKRSNKRDSVSEHLIAITDYLARNIDYEDGTNCLKILAGDWNDAIDGLGKSADENKKFGTGVSVMASLHFYRNLYEMIEILKVKQPSSKKIDEYSEIREKLKQGLIKHAIETNENNQKRLIHGWGDHIKYKIGSFCDSDNQSRISFAPNAFWATSKLIYDTPELKEIIIKTLHSLDSGYGLKTLTPAFSPETPGVGRIAGIIPGTAENECVYIHASMFSIMALFMLGDSDFAWESLIKVISPTHPGMSKSPFVMTNSYLENKEYGYNGQSAIDWFTGSGTVFIKNIIRYCVGIEASMQGIVIQPSNSTYCRRVTADLLIKGRKIKFKYENKQTGRRVVKINGELVENVFDEIMGVNKAFIPNEKITEGAEIIIFD